MREMLLPQRFLITRHEAYCLCHEISRRLYRPITPESRMQPFEVLASLHLKTAGRKLAQRLARQQSGDVLKVTFTAYEIISIHQCIDTYPVDLYNILAEIDRKTLNYDQIVDFLEVNP